MSSSSCSSALCRWLFLGLCATPWPAVASWEGDLGSPQLVGQGEFDYLGFHIYSAALYSTRLPFSRLRPFALQLTYFKHITRARITETSLNELRRIYGKALSEETLAVWQQYMLSAFVDVDSGDTLTGVYLPGQGIRFYHGDTETARFADAYFAEAFFNIWLAPQTRDPDLRARLLGQTP
ncbi:chalcone isomerase family protein [Silvimonas iriomotensis]|uniref:Chalcone isomerase domain-containing protein n=1 Tax=Silvimonas iriomotensis TaxID=449662 RepID=A0ABQ2P8W4_9NEIS|nr:chalcone isomerase family protein [Silvimonas iriomotensis]GGP21164.1 hypothetical protein GCM10010970_19130 [Silvimonas iriomotensis]